MEIRFRPPSGLAETRPLPDNPRKLLSHEEQVDVRFHLLYAGLPVERQSPVTVKVATLTDLVHQEAQLGDQRRGPPYRRCRLQLSSDRGRFFCALSDGPSDGGDVLRVRAQIRGGALRSCRQLDVPRHAFGGLDEPVAKPRPPDFSRVECMENVTGMAPHRPEVAEVPCRKVGVQDRDPRFGRGRRGKSPSVKRRPEAGGDMPNVWGHFPPPRRLNSG